MQWIGWTHTYNPGEYIQGDGNNNKLELTIRSTPDNISIMGYLYINQSISIKPDSTTPSIPSIPDTSNNNP